MVSKSVGLPSSALAVMLGIVFIVNAHRYGVLGVVSGVVLVAGGLALGIRCFRTESTAPTQEKSRT